MEKKYKILIVDDNENDVEMLMEGIAADDRFLIPVYSGKDALRCAEKECPDLVLLDVMMPDMDGYEVCTHLKENVKTRNIPVIFLTGMTDSSDVTKGLELGAVDYIIKPYHLVEINARIKNHLALQKGHRRSIDLLKGFASSISDVAFMLDKDMRVVELIGQYKKYFPELTGIGVSDNLGDYLKQSMKKQFTTAITTLIETKEEFEFETETIVDGKKAILQIAMSIVENRDNIPKVISVKIIDITQRKHTERQVDLIYEYQKRSRFFNSILSGSYNEEQQNQLLSIYGIESKKPLVCYVVATSLNSEHENTENRINSSIGEWLLEKGYGWIWHTKFGLGVLMQYPNTRIEIERVAKLMKESIGLRFPNLEIYIGVAENRAGIVDFKQLYYDALASLMRAIDVKQEYAFLEQSESGLYEVIIHMLENMDVKKFIDKVLGKIIEHDEKNGSELMITLETLIGAGSVKSVAAQLFIHPNTVLWRKQKIEEILGISLESIDMRTQINLAFKLKRVYDFMQRS